MLTNFFYLAVAAHGGRDAGGAAGPADGAGQRAHAGRPAAAAAGRAHGRRMALLGAPIMLVLFMLFPRLAPLWGMPERRDDRPQRPVGHDAGRQHRAAGAGRRHRRCASSFDGGRRRAQRDLYFRGPVLSQLRRPRVARAAAAPARARCQLPADLQRAAASRCATRSRWSRATGPGCWCWMPRPKPRRSRRAASVVHDADLQWLANRPVDRPAALPRRELPAVPQRPAAAHAPRCSDYLELPPGFNPRTAGAGRARCAPTPRWPAPARRAGAAPRCERLRTGGYSYTLEPGVYGDDTADEFWFDRKEGFCEHIASAFVVLMRALDIPARIVTGYQGGELNGVDGFWVRAPERRPRLGRGLAWPAAAGCASTRPPPSSPGRIGAFQRLQAPPRRLRRRHRRREPDLAAEPARGLGGAEQQLEPVGAQLHAEPAARPAARTWASSRRAGRT